jgi:N6-L-threonylcarbamoyladenine synthase
MLILGIESSCDETGVALVESGGAAVPVLRSHALFSQVDMHQAYGGVVPELASRDHIRRVLPLTELVLRDAGPTGGRGRGRFHARAGAGRRAAGGAGVACALGAALERPVLGVHHLEGHLLSPFLSADPPEFPVCRAAGLGRPHPADAGGRGGALRHCWARPSTTPRARPSTNPPS